MRWSPSATNTPTIATGSEVSVAAEPAEDTAALSGTDPLVFGERAEAGGSAQLRADPDGRRCRARPGLAQIPRRTRVRLPALAGRVRRRRRVGPVPGDLRRGVRPCRGATSARHHRRRPGRAGADQVRQRRAEVALSGTHPARRRHLDPVVLRARRRLRPRRRAHQGRADRRPAGGSTARRSGVLPRTRPTTACCSRVPAPTSTAACRCSSYRWTRPASACGR